MYWYYHISITRKVTMPVVYIQATVHLSSSQELSVLPSCRYVFLFSILALKKLKTVKCVTMENFHPCLVIVHKKIFFQNCYYF